MKLHGYRSHTGKGCTTLATPGTASAGQCHMSNQLGLLKNSHGAICLIASCHAYLFKARSTAAAGKQIN
eukprot:364585-Chlamydomonas_euryale.AAC.1